MKFHTLAALSALALAGCAPVTAQESQPAASLPAPTQNTFPPQKPTLIVAISMDQFSGDLFNEYRQHFTGGLKRMASGAVFSSAFQGHAATETCPGHSTLLTGSFPARTGIVANDWIDWSVTRENKEVYCSEDPTQAAPEGNDYFTSPVKLLMPTLGERMVAADPRTRNVAVSGKDRGALMMGGKTVQQVYYWNGKSAFTTLPGRTPLPLLATFNASLAQQLSAPRAASALPAHCASRDHAVQVAPDFSVGTWRFDRKADDTRAFRASPDFDKATLDLATAVLDDMKLGQGPQTDMLSISLSATDYVGHGFGTEGVEMCIQMAEVDARLNQFFDHLDAKGIDYAVVLSADHGGLDTPERARMQGMPDATRVKPTLRAKAIEEAITKRTGIKLPEKAVETASGEVYLNPVITGQDRQKALAAAIAYARADSQVAAIFTRQDLSALPMPTGSPREWSLAERARASFHPERSGDFLIMLKPRITPIAAVKAGGAVATHGSPWDYDRRVALAFWQKGLPAFEQPQSVSTADIMPTLAALIGLPVDTKEIDGRCLDLNPGTATTCPQ